MHSSSHFAQFAHGVKPYYVADSPGGRRIVVSELSSDLARKETEIDGHECLPHCFKADKISANFTLAITVNLSLMA